MRRVVLTGAAGRLGSYLREPLLQLADELVSSDIVENIGKLYERETYVRADLGNFAEINALLQGADMVVHFGAIGDEAPFEEIHRSNILGAYNVWEAAFQNKLRRVVYASSIHAVGMYPKTEFIGTDVPHRPDTFYGLAKCFAEDLARLYWDKRQIEAVCLRILSCAQVTSARALGTWLSYDDLIALVKTAIVSPITEFSIIYGVSNNDRTPVDNAAASFLGFRPKDNAEQFANKIFLETAPVDPTDLTHLCHGGPFASIELGQSAKATMKIVDDAKKI